MADASTTARVAHIPVVLALGFSDVFVERARDLALAMVPPALLKGCDVVSIATLAARWRPFAILALAEIAAFDRPELEALAMSVGAALLELPDENVSEEWLKRELERSGSEAQRRRAKAT